MPRPPRLVVPTVPLHVIQRGNNRSRMFVDASDYKWFRAALLTESARARCAIHAYVFMPNHVHVLLTPADAVGPAHLMQRLGGGYVRYFNDRYARTGTLWEGRFRSNLVDTNHYFFACSRYIELNASRAGMVTDPGEYRWSSYRGNAIGAPDPMLTAHPLYECLHPMRSQRIAAYRGMFNMGFDNRLLDSIRRAARRGRPLGSAEFRGAMDARRPAATTGKHGGDRKSPKFRVAYRPAAR